eukprot:Nk52_evm51s1444 gene=Nk52_evmTU51s1444
MRGYANAKLKASGQERTKGGKTKGGSKSLARQPLHMVPTREEVQRIGEDIQRIYRGGCETRQQEEEEELGREEGAGDGENEETKKVPSSATLGRSGLVQISEMLNSISFSGSGNCEEYGGGGDDGVAMNGPVLPPDRKINIGLIGNCYGGEEGDKEGQQDEERATGECGGSTTAQLAFVNWYYGYNICAGLPRKNDQPLVVTGEDMMVNDDLLQGELAASALPFFDDEILDPLRSRVALKVCGAGSSSVKEQLNERRRSVQQMANEAATAKLTGNNTKITKRDREESSSSLSSSSSTSYQGMVTDCQVRFIILPSNVCNEGKDKEALNHLVTNVCDMVVFFLHSLVPLVREAPLETYLTYLSKQLGSRLHVCSYLMVREELEQLGRGGGAPGATIEKPDNNGEAADSNELQLKFDLLKRTPSLKGTDLSLKTFVNKFIWQGQDDSRSILSDQQTDDTSSATSIETSICPGDLPLFNTRSSCILLKNIWFNLKSDSRRTSLKDDIGQEIPRDLLIDDDNVVYLFPHLKLKDPEKIFIYSDCCGERDGGLWKVDCLIDQSYVDHVQTCIGQLENDRQHLMSVCQKYMKILAKQDHARWRQQGIGVLVCLLSLYLPILFLTEMALTAIYPDHWKINGESSLPKLASSAQQPCSVCTDYLSGSIFFSLCFILNPIMCLFFNSTDSNLSSPVVNSLEPNSIILGLSRLNNYRSFLISSLTQQCSPEMIYIFSSIGCTIGLLIADSGPPLYSLFRMETNHLFSDDIFPKRKPSCKAPVIPLYTPRQQLDAFVQYLEGHVKHKLQSMKHNLDLV